MAPAGRTRIVIMGAAGRDFHNFNVVYRSDPAVEVVAFTATQIPGIADRRYPPVLAGPLYPDGIPIVPESALEEQCRAHEANLVVFAYSDVTHAAVMHAASRSLAAGADFALLGPARTMLRAAKPVIAISAIRTGCGKSQTARYVANCLRQSGRRVAVVRHPMPYGDLARQRLQRFAEFNDLAAAECTNEEREEYEPHIAAGSIVFAGVDYAAILARAEQEADIILWDGGNNDFPFFRPDLHIVMADALRPGQAAAYHPGEAVLRMADVIVLNKVDVAEPASVAAIGAELRAINGHAPLVLAASPVTPDNPNVIRGKRVLVVEDGPTITHGGRPYGAGLVAARKFGAAEIVDPRKSADPMLAALYAQYPHIGPVLPDVGYSADEVAALRRTIAGAAADLVVVATPIDPAAIVAGDKPYVRVRYDYADAGEPKLSDLIARFLARGGRSC